MYTLNAILVGEGRLIIWYKVPFRLRSMKIFISKYCQYLIIQNKNIPPYIVYSNHVDTLLNYGDFYTAVTFKLNFIIE